MVIALLEHLEETYNKARRGEHQDLEVDVDGRAGPYLTVSRAGQLRCACKADFCTSLYTWYPEYVIRDALKRRYSTTHFHTTTFSAGTYLAFPFATLQSTLMAFSGVGIRMTTLVADSLLLKLVFTVTTYDTCVVPISFTVGITRSGSLTLDVARYLQK